MQKNAAIKLSPIALLLSILLHILFLFLILINLISKPEKQEKPAEHYVPAYVYKGAITPSQHLSKPITKQPIQQTKREATKKPLHTIENKRQQFFQPSDKTITRGDTLAQKSILDVSREVLRGEVVNRALSQIEDEEPILLIGDKNKIADPLIKLIGRALSAHFVYPAMEGNFGITGRVIVEMTIHPEGFFSDVRIIQSSDNQDFDAAALYAVNTAPTVKGLAGLLPKPKHLVVGFIFN